MKKIAFIGPRLQKGGPIGYYGENSHPGQKAIHKSLEELTKEYAKSHILLTGLAGGIETWAAEYAIKHKMGYVIIEPHKNPWSKVPDFKRLMHQHMLENAIEIRPNTEFDDWSVDAMRSKEEKMLTEADIIVSFFSADIKLVAEMEKKGKQILRPFRSAAPVTASTDGDIKIDDEDISF